MLANQLAVKYAQALFELASEQQRPDEVAAQLHMVVETVTEHQELATLLYHPRIPATAKKETISKIFSQELTESVYRFLMLLIDKHREAILPAIEEEYTKFVNETNHVMEAMVTTAMPLAASEEAALSAKLSRVTGKKVILRTTIDQAIIGGIIVKMGDKLIDGSVVRQLQVLKNSLLSNEAKIGVTNQV
ncbi:hypothetical protein P22_1564 [Propionispora sp. 2/2-37]|uniref:F0F1 ATP synthase subunit delta n=1 Tax=Propionispora sp. 2/2-37 TaxID=1677858 RepID=UPI0006BB7AD1|nr:F0F1 ATP synthase subunit delta [Propionispora sp. 2/2-37]CUH95493.1 hypothetical protein P22_1564 [Propionispora sp. 2/2-37]